MYVYILSIREVIMVQVTVYFSPTCPVCAKLKEYLKKKGVRYTSINVLDDEKARDEMIEKTGQLVVPQTEINGSFVIGFDKKALEEHLKNV